MAERYKLWAAPRTMMGKVKVKKLKAQGFLPAIMYGRGIEPTPLQVRAEEFQQLLKTGGYNVVLDLEVEGMEGPQTVILKKVARSALTGGILNLDFHKISTTDRIHARVPLHLIGTPRGVSTGGGMLLQPVSDLEIICLATELPAAIEADITGLGLDESLHVRDLKLPEGIETTAPAGEVLAIVHPPKGAVEEAAEGEQTTEPELAAKPKEA